MYIAQTKTLNLKHEDYANRTENLGGNESTVAMAG